MSTFSPEGTSANEADIRDRATDLYNFAARIVGSAEDGRALFTSAAVEFTDLVAEDIRSQAEYNRTAWRKASLMAVYAGGVTEGWANDVRWFTQRLSELEDEWEEARADRFGVHPPSGVEGVEERFSALRARARAAKLASLDSRAEYARTEFERRARMRANQLQDGPTDATIKQLVRDDGVLGWAPHNLGWSHPPLPLDAEQGDGLAEELQSYLNGEVPIDDRFFAILAIVDSVTSKALRSLKSPDGERLEQEEIAFLRSFYDRLDETTVPFGLGPTSMLNLVRGFGDVNGLSEAEQNQFLGTLGSGLLVLSNERLGGGWDDLPPTIQAAVTHGHTPDVDLQQGMFPEDWLEGWAPVLAELFRETDGGLEGGKDFSANLLTTLGTNLDEAMGPRGILPKDDMPLQELLRVVSRNEEAVHAVVTGEHDHPVWWDRHAEEYVYPDGRDTQEAIRGLYGFDWSDDGSALRGLTEWIGPEYVRNDPDRRELADETMAGLITALTDGPSGTFDLLAGDNDITGDNANLGMLNPDAARGLAGLSEFYLESFAQPHRQGETTVGADGGLEVNSVDRVRFWMLIAGDQQAANDLNTSIQEYQFDRYQDFVNGDAPAITVGDETAQLRGLYDLALIYEARARENYAAEDALTAEGSSAEGYDSDQSAWIKLTAGSGKEIVNNIIAQNDFVKAGVGVGNEIVKFTQNYGIGSEATEGGFDPRLPTTRSEGDVEFATMLAMADIAVGTGRLDPADLPHYQEYQQLAVEFDRHASAGDHDKAVGAVDDMVALSSDLKNELIDPLRDLGIHDADLIQAQRDTWDGLLGDPEGHDMQRFRDTILSDRMRRNQPD
jgi:hypothetical protein